MISVCALSDLTFLFKMKLDIAVAVLFLKRERFVNSRSFMFFCGKLNGKVFAELLRNERKCCDFNQIFMKL